MFQFQSNDTLFSLALLVYEKVFAKNKIDPDILLRDYVRNIIERVNYLLQDTSSGIGMKVIRPPYQSDKFPKKYQTSKLINLRKIRDLNKLYFL